MTTHVDVRSKVVLAVTNALPACTVAFVVLVIGLGAQQGKLGQYIQHHTRTKENDPSQTVLVWYGMVWYGMVW